MELGSSVLYENTKADRRKVSRPMTTLDLLAGEHRMERVDLLKLDVQGYELEVLNGAAALLLRADLVLLEVSLLPIIQGAPLMPEVIAFMRARNFVPYDICTHMRRPSDLTLWQVDMLFARADSPLLVNCAL